MCFLVPQEVSVIDFSEDQINEALSSRGIVKRQATESLDSNEKENEEL